MKTLNKRISEYTQWLLNKRQTRNITEFKVISWYNMCKRNVRNHSKTLHTE
jgi:hypothetical protein